MFRPSCKTTLLATLSLICCASASFAAGVIYNQTSGTGLQVNFGQTPAALDDVNFAAGSTAVRQQLSGLTFGVGVAGNVTAQTATVFIDFYDTFNAAGGTSVAANYLGGFGGTLSIAANTSSTPAARAFTFSGLTALTVPIFFNDPSIAIVITLANAAGTAYSTILTPLFSVPGTPSTGSSVPGLYRDLNADGNFSTSEFQATQGNLYLSLTTVDAPAPAPVPELGGTAALLSLALVALVPLRKRVRAS